MGDVRVDELVDDGCMDTALPKLLRRPRWPQVLAVVGITASLFNGFDSLLDIALIFVIVVPFEKWFPRHRQRLRRPKVGTDIAYALVATPLAAAGVFVGIVLTAVSFARLPGLLLRPLVGALPSVVRMLLGVLLFDFLIYWVHRFSHEVPFMWRFHRIHHSTQHLDWVSGFRGHPFDGILAAPAFVLLLVAGFSAEFSGALLVIQIATGLFLHANVRWRWRPLHKIVITPEFHHWHHSNEVDARSTNYSVFLPLWDIAFGTYFMPANRRPAVYGIDGDVSDGIVGQLWDPMRGLRNPLRMLRHPWLALRELARMVRRGLGQMRQSAMRHRVRQPVS